ncbi:MAG: hypothetical protein B7733_20675 [Myxococcales bacterium FL481]|nr:MAG: hypothetical protein B7733_20675 [Myxococcales bacterium FL481]
MRSMRDWLKKAESIARDRLGDEWVEEGRRVGSTLWQRSPKRVRQAAERLGREVLAWEPSPAAATARSRGAADGDGGADATPHAGRDRTSESHDGEAPPEGRASSEASRTEAEASTSAEPRPDDATVVVYTTTETGDAAERIRQVIRRRDVYVRLVNLASHPHMARQIAEETQVFVAPYVYIRGRFWGAENEISALEESGELDVVLRGDLDALGDAARRIGRIRGTFSADLTEANILDRLRRGHILTIDDLDCWYEDDGDESRFYYQGGLHPVQEMPSVAKEIARAAAADEIEAQWHLEPVVHVG